MAGGRPPKFDTPEQMQEAIDAYFAECELREVPYTMTGLALALDLTRQGLLDYKAKSELFDSTIKRAKSRVEMTIEEGLLMGKGGAAGAIFNLKNNYGWKDKTEQDINHSGGLDLTAALDAARKKVEQK